MDIFDFDAGKYALYVWGAWGATALVFLWMVADSVLRARTWRRRAERAEQARDGGRAGGA
jgi:heme exporter protein D